MARRYKIAAAATGTDANAAAYAQILRRGRIVGAQVCVDIDSVTDNSYLVVELSLQAVGQIAANDTLGDLAAVAWRGNGTAPLGQLNEWLPIDVQVDEGQRVYLNVNAGGTLAAGIMVYLWVQEGV